MSIIFSRLISASTRGRHHLVVPRRWSGHNAMDIEPSNYAWKKFKDYLHFYFTLALVPIFVAGSIISTRANPVLVEIPEGYEPRHWEYYRHPITRFMARYFFTAPDIDEECQMALFEHKSEAMILQKVQRDVDTVMSFYNDHRARYFAPFYGEHFRISREALNYGYPYTTAEMGVHYDDAYTPGMTTVPVEGYKPAEGGPPE